MVNPCLSFAPFYMTQNEPRLRSYHCRPDQRKRLHPGPEQLRVPQHPRGGAPLLHSAPAFQRRRAHDPATPSASHALTPHQPSLGIQNKHFWADMDQKFPPKKITSSLTNVYCSGLFQEILLCNLAVCALSYFNYFYLVIRTCSQLTLCQ